MGYNFMVLYIQYPKINNLKREHIKMDEVHVRSVPRLTSYTDVNALVLTCALVT